MKRLIPGALIVWAVLAGGCAHTPSPISAPSDSEENTLKRYNLTFISNGKLAEETPYTLIAATQDSGASKASPETAKPEGEAAPKNEGTSQEMEEEKGVTIADPLEPFNRAMYQFNDKLYFWVLKPVAQGYNKVVPEPARISVNHFFSNLRFPIRFISCLFQADFKCVGTELGRFTVNTIWGVGGLLDPSSNPQLNIPRKKADLGQTLGFYGLGPGFYFVWPVLGPSSARDSIDIAGSYFLYPISYLANFYESAAVRVYEEVNDTSLRIGDYEALKEAAIDPYVALRDAYAQYRQGLVEAAGGRKQAPPRPGGVILGEPQR